VVEQGIIPNPGLMESHRRCVGMFSCNAPVSVVRLSMQEEGRLACIQQVASGGAGWLTCIKIEKLKKKKKKLATS